MAENNIFNSIRLSREYALLGKYDVALIYYDSVLTMIEKCIGRKSEIEMNWEKIANDIKSERTLVEDITKSLEPKPQIKEKKVPSVVTVHVPAKKKPVATTVATTKKTTSTNDYLLAKGGVKKQPTKTTPQHNDSANHHKKENRENVENVNDKKGAAVNAEKADSPSSSSSEEAVNGESPVEQSDDINFDEFGADKQLAQMIFQDSYFKSVSSVTFSKIASLKDAKRLIQEATILPLHMPDFFTGIRKPWGGVLMFGPPGTGKTLLAKAVAAECKMSFFSVSSAILTSKYRGESEKLVRILFKLARIKGPSIIFIDEIDALCSSRGADGEHEASRRLKTEILTQMNGVEDNDTSRVIVLAATNHPWDLDSALIRRLEKRIYIPLPDLEGRIELFKINLEGLSLDKSLEENFENTLTELAQRCEYYSGADVSIVCRDACMMPMRRIINNLSMDEIINLTQEKKSAMDLPIIRQDIEDAIKKVSPTTCLEDIQKFCDWKDKFGSC